MFKIKQLLLFLVCCITLLFSSIQSSLAIKFPLDRLNVADGLPSTIVNTIYQQKNGFIWFATDSGVSRYDGREFIHYQFSPGKPNHISNNFVTDVIEDELGNIWFATEDGLNKLDKAGNISIYNTQNSGITSNWILGLYIDEKSRLWLNTGSGLSLYHPDDTFSHFPLVIDGEEIINSTYATVEDAQGTLWLGTDAGLAYKKADSHTLTLFKPNESSLLLEADEAPTEGEIFGDYFYVGIRATDDTILFGTHYSGLVLFNPKTGHYKRLHNKGSVLDGTYLPRNTIHNLEKISDDKFWVGLDDGVVSLNIFTGQYEYLTSQVFNDDSLPSNSISEIYVDTAGNTWFASDKGVAYYSPLKSASQIYKQLPHNSELSGSVVYSLANSFDNQVYIASDGGIDKFDLPNNTMTLHPYSDSTDIFNDEVWGVRVDKQQNVWFVHAEGLSVYYHEKQQLVHYNNRKGNPHGLPERDLYTVEPDNQGGAWLTGYMTSIFYFHPEQQRLNAYFDDNTNLYVTGGNFSFQTILTQQGHLWAATTNSIFIIDPINNTTQHLNLGTEVENLRVSGLYEDKQGIIWAAVQGLGLAKITVNQDASFDIQYFNEQHGLKDNRLKAVIGDEHGDLWVTTRYQLVKFSIEKQRFTHYPSVFNQENMTFYEAAIALVDKQLLLGSNIGLLSVDTQQIRTNPYQPRIHITSAVIAGDKELIGQQLKHVPKIDYDKSIIQFSFASLDYTEPERNQYRYQLVGFDDSWISAQNSPQAMYTNLPAGRYTFKVQGTNSDGIWSPHEAQFTFEINRPWWLYALFILVTVIVFIVVLYIYKRYQQINELSLRANYDSLTGLYNRYNFNQTLQNQLQQSSNYGAVVFIDLDHFKEVNDSMGHDVGDELIIQVAKRLKHSLKKHDVLARLGGDEFAIIINETSPKAKDELPKIMERIRAALNAGYQINEHWLNSSASIGVARFPQDGTDVKTLLKHADTAMYAAKQSGRNGTFFFNEQLSTALIERLSIKNKLNFALKNHELSLLFQPKIDLKTRSIIGAEGLLRWYHPQEGFIAPDKFIPEAEQSGQIIEIGLWVIEQACIQAKHWDELGLLETNVSINISPIQLTHASFVSDIARILNETRLTPNKLELEITESLLIEDVELSKLVLSKLKDIGVRIGLDDFGKGYSSLNYLTQFPIDTLKLDKGFMSGALEHDASHIILKNVVNLGRELQLDVIVEGIETERQLALLSNYQCQWGQGFLFSPAISAEELTKQLLKQQHTQSQPIHLSRVK
ncbi:EAL domain-containing protein [Shewanella maritima]|uniref:EAL domain-containing protein n=1 Tax=Shewanella maritima TaxID=2520507 RepID=UPI003734C406